MANVRPDFRHRMNFESDRSGKSSKNSRVLFSLLRGQKWWEKNSFGWNLLGTRVVLVQLLSSLWVSCHQLSVLSLLDSCHQLSVLSLLDSCRLTPDTTSRAVSLLFTITLIQHSQTSKLDLDTSAPALIVNPTAQCLGHPVVSPLAPCLDHLVVSPTAPCLGHPVVSPTAPCLGHLDTISGPFT